MNQPLLLLLTDLFRQAGPAHHRAYIETDGSDPEWPLWYADYLRESLGRLLDHNFTRSELVYLLVLADQEQKAKAPGADWPAYYARFFVEMLQDRNVWIPSPALPASKHAPPPMPATAG